MEFFNNMKLKWKLASGFALPLILLVIISSTVNLSLNKLIDISGWVNHTHEVIKMADDITASLVNMETGLRGYLIAGEEEFLEPYRGGKSKFKELIAKGQKKVSDNPAQVERLEQVSRLEDEWLENHVQVAIDLRQDVNKGRAKMSEVTAFIQKAIGKTYMDKMRGIIDKFISEEAGLIGIRGAEQKNTADTTTDVTLIGTLIALLLGVSAAWVIIRNLGRMIGGEPIYAIEVANEIANGNLSVEVQTNEGDTSSLLNQMKQMRESLLARNSADKEAAAVTTRIKMALDVCATNVMMADTDLNINYMNNAINHMMADAEADLKQVLPSFDAKNLMGENIDVFHKNPSHQRNLLAGLTTTYQARIVVGARTFDLTATPIFDESKERLGTVVEWSDITARLAKEVVEKELADSNSGIKLALDACNTNVMMADPDFNITYMNQSVNQMMLTAEQDLKVALPNFNAKNLMGQNIDVFHKNPAHQRGMLEGLNEVYKTNINIGSRTFGLIATPIFNDDKERLGTVVEWDDMTERLALEVEAKIISDENAGIKIALDVCDTNVMMADTEFNINYMNQAVSSMMKVAERDLQAVLSNFDANNLMGKNIDVFHKNPAHQRNMLAALKDVYRTQIKVGTRTFGLTATPIFNEQEDRLGTVVEWVDRTVEVGIESEMDSLITSANDGDLSKRLELEGKVGFFKSMSEGLNNLMDSTEVFVGDVGHLFEAMAQGDLTQSITSNYKGEFDRIKLNANNTIAKMSEVLSGITSASRNVETSSGEVEEGSDDLSRRTESQASTLEETASSMEEITATVKQTAENADQSTRLAEDAKKKAEEGGAVVKDAVGAMAEILESSNKINDIIGVIDEIAFQTNLLALNAAVEAARAGEQGRGFAVVAGEVRTLSQRSAAAAKEIKDLIRDSVNKVEQGSNLVNQSGIVLKEIVDAVDSVSGMISDVSIAAAEQNSGIAQINQAIAGMDEMTQQNAALVEESSAASRSMSEETKSMNGLISFFNIGGGNTSAQTPIKTHQPSKPQPKKSAGGGGSSAASFSKSDDWEDF